MAKILGRTHYCGELRESNIGQTVTVCGFVQKNRSLGQLIFTDLRDRTGIIQLSFDDKTNKDIFELANTLRSEFVIAASGIVTERAAKNKDIPTGDIEVHVDELKIYSKALTPPFEILDDVNTNEELRLKYRYLDLRRTPLQNNILLRHKVVKAARDYYDQNGFLEIETPMMIKSTPEGARDFLVPSRIHKHSFYALPQSPQIYKQLLMVSGFDRYMQIARCFRDEDLRADRQPEFTQIDLEMSFVTQDDVLDINEGFIQYLFKNVMDADIPLPLPRMTYDDAMNKYGSDKPDTRFDMFINDISEVLKDTEFPVFKSALESGGTVRAIVAKNAANIYTRKEIDKLIEFAKGIGAKGIAYIRWTDDAVSCSFNKFLKENELDNILTATGAEKGDLVLIMADRVKTVLHILGALRLEVAKKLDIIPDKYNFLWITEFPFFEFDEEQNKYVAMHHPFTSPLDECIQYLETAPEKVKAQAYDLVLNGVELSSGSIRITDPELQGKMFDALGLSKEEAEYKFGFLTNAFKYGAPPHGGMGIGLDRLIMIMSGSSSIRDVIAFPKVQNASELMTACPSKVDAEQLIELGISLIEQKED